MANLPNPNMEFVPLDILTASQLNQIVANILYLLGIASGEKLDDGAIKNRHLSEEVLANINRLDNIPELSSFPVGYGLVMYVTKIGKIAFAEINGQVINIRKGNRSERIPSNLLPRHTTFIQLQATNNTNDVGSGIIKLFEDGGIEFHGCEGHNEYYAKGFYILK